MVMDMGNGRWNIREGIGRGKWWAVYIENLNFNFLVCVFVSLKLEISRTFSSRL